jgi:predicted RNase H-like nuclease (RuvC/YqgF family)
LGRISQSNIDFKTRSERLEAANAELSSELEQHRTRVSTLEMELEMTKENADHDFEKQVELIRTELND